MATLLVLTAAAVALLTLNIKDEMEKMKGIETDRRMEMAMG